MVVLSFWLPILLASVLVFVASSIIHMVFRYHNSEYRGFSNEAAVADVIRAGAPTPGNYALPYCAEMKEMGSPEFVEKTTRGPVAFVTIRKSGPPGMGPALFGWFIWTVVVGVFTAYVAGISLAPDAEYLTIFRTVGATAFLAYGVGVWPEVIWFGRPVSGALKHTFDGLVYSLLTAGAFGWLWPTI